MKLSHINTALLAAIIFINCYIIFAPLWPTVAYQVNRTKKEATLQNKVESQTKATGPNRLIVPEMLLETPLLESPASQAYQALNKGVWRLNKGSTPDKGGNTVLVGHRFTYTNPQGVFYHLDKLKVGDTLAVIWDQQKYLYTVRQIKTVPPSETSIEAPTDTDQLTLYTCTPLWLPKDRLVVIANLEAQ